MKKAPIIIRSRNRECSTAAHRFTLRMAAFTVIASKYAPNTQGPILSENGVIAAARRAITSSSGQCNLGKCEWARTSQTSARARLQNSRVLLQLVVHLP